MKNGTRKNVSWIVVGRRMTSEIVIHLEDARWKKVLRPYCKSIQSVCNAVAADRHKQLEIAVVLTDDVRIQSLNNQYRSKNKPTNVLSFPIDACSAGKNVISGDIILAYDTIDRESIAQEKTFRDHATHLIIHGLLHLMGHDHEEEAEARKMERIEVKILATLGISNPYL